MLDFGIQQCFTPEMAKRQNRRSKKQKQPALALAIKVVGGPQKLADFINKNYGPITIQAVSNWKRCPPNRVLQIEHATNFVVRRHRLRPDLYPPKERAGVERAVAAV